MTTDYAGAAAWCEGAEKMYRAQSQDWLSPQVVARVSQEEREEKALAMENTASHANTALRAVRAWEAVASGRVALRLVTGGIYRNQWRAIRLGEGVAFYSPDPLDAVTRALEASDAT